MGGIARGILVARLTIYGNQAMAVSRIGVDCRPRRSGHRGVVAGGTPAPPFNQEAVAADPAYLKANSAQFGLKLALPIPYRSAEDSL